jgi:hypothetical protein
LTWLQIEFSPALLPMFDSRFGPMMKIPMNATSANVSVIAIWRFESCSCSSSDWFVEIIMARIPIDSASLMAATPRKMGFFQIGLRCAHPLTGCVSR